MMCLHRKELTYRNVDDISDRQEMKYEHKQINNAKTRIPQVIHLLKDQQMSSRIIKRRSLSVIIIKIFKFPCYSNNET